MRSFFAILAAALIAAGCHNGGTNQNSTDLRAVNAVVDAEPLDILVDGDVKFAAVAPNTATSFTNFDSGGRELVVRSSTNQAVLFDKSVQFGSDSRSTLLIFGKRSSVAATVLADDATAPASGHVRVRVAGLAPDAGSVDVYLTPTDISAGPAIVSGAGPSAVTAVSEVNSGTFRVIVTTAGTQDILFQSTGTIAFNAGDNLTLAILPSLGGKLVNVMLVQQGAGGTATFLSNPSARVKAVNAVPTSSGLNFKADGNTLLSAVPFTGNSSYVNVAAGSRTLQLEASNVPGTTVASVTKTVDAARDFTLLAMASGSATSLVVLPDDNTLPSTGNAKVRFVNALADGAKADALVNFASQATGIAAGSASGYFTIAAGINYTITFATPGAVSVVASLTGVELDVGQVYTVYLFGTSANAQAKLVRDR